MADMGQEATDSKRDNPRVVMTMEEPGGGTGSGPQVAEQAQSWQRW